MAWASFMRRGPSILRVLAVAMALSISSGDGGVRAQASSGEAVAKARFTITIARFVQWPTAEAAPLRICTLHNSPALGAAFAALEGQRVAGQPIIVAQNPRDLAGCSLLFIDGSAAHGSASAIAAAAGLQMLTVGAVDGFLSSGGMIELANVNDTLRFDINLKSVRSARLELSSQVLDLARRIRN
jgi:hypothetical protein